MKKIQPYYFLIVFAVMLLAAGAVTYGLRSLSMLKGGKPIEPPVDDHEGDLFELWFTRADLFDVSVDRNATGIIFGSDSKKVSLLSRERQLLWEKDFSTNPLQTQISSCGNYLAVGTEGGELFFMSIASQSWWQEGLSEPVNLVELSANGRWVLAGRGDPEKKEHHLELYSREGSQQWTLSTGPLQKIYLAGEEPGEGKIFYTHRKGDSFQTEAVTLAGKELWAIKGSSLLAVSRTESRLALATESGELGVYSDSGELIWEKPLPDGLKVSSASFNPQENSLLVYGSNSGAEENLYYYDSSGAPIWKKKIAEGALASFTVDGARIITCSWRQYKEDFSQIVLYDESGAELSHWEVGMRVEKMLITGNRRYIVLAGEDSYIDVVDLESTPDQENGENAAAVPFYSPVRVGLKTDQAAITLYFFSSGSYIPITRLISRTKSPLDASIEELIRGPSRESSLCRTIPKGSEIKVLFSGDSGELYLELSPESGDADELAQIPGVLDSLRYTLGGFSEVRDIYLTVDEEPLELGEKGRPLKQPLKPYRWKEPLFIPMHIEARYYLVPVEARDLKIKERDLFSLLQTVTKQCRSLYFVPGNLTLIEVAERGETVRINLNRSFEMLFPEDGNTEDQLQAAMILDALFLTALENSGCTGVEVYIEGESWSPPPDYPALNRAFYQSYYINPEF